MVGEEERISRFPNGVSNENVPGVGFRPSRVSFPGVGNRWPGVVGFAAGAARVVGVDIFLEIFWGPFLFSFGAAFLGNERTPPLFMPYLGC